MPEIKHSFTTGKMNKDLDERLVPQGEYRDALNIEVRTSDGSDIGTVQTLHGNKERLSWDDTTYPVNPTVSWTGKPSRFVGSIADGKTDRAYFFVASPPVEDLDVTSIYTGGHKLYKDMIIMYDNVTKELKPVITDIFRVEWKGNDQYGPSDGWGSSDTSYDYIDFNQPISEHVRPGMRMRVYGTDGLPLTGFSTELYDYDDESLLVREVKVSYNSSGFYNTRVYFSTMAIGSLVDAHAFVFEADKVLNFTNTTPYDVTEDVLITGINVIDNLLLWTDNKSEPKKINIDRCIGEVNGDIEKFDLHSRLKITKPGTDTLEYAFPFFDSNPFRLDPGLKEEHISVIRRAPRTSPKLVMSSSASLNNEGVETDPSGFISDKSFVDSSGNLLEVGVEVDVLIEGIDTGAGVAGTSVAALTGRYSNGQVVFLRNNDDTGIEYKVQATVISSYFDEEFWTYRHVLVINSISSDIHSGITTWETTIDQGKPLFEFNLGRFSYRYKYQDGEYSSFAPWSELAFLPGKQNYIPSQGYNLGMVNTIRSLKITNFIVSDYQRPDDIIGVDILYKDTISPNVRVVKSIKKGLDPEWNPNGTNTGVVNISSEMMHQTLPSSQILRAWDNVPKLAKSQEVTGNRLVYGNYLQNFNVKAPVVVKPSVLSVDHAGTGSEDDNQYLIPVKSLKSIRKYKIGVVFGDKYGRETPVMGIGGETGEVTITPSSVSVDKKNSSSVNKLQAELSWGNGTPDDWMEYYKYYVKETTNEYYNLVLHRWYNAEDGNIWLAFASADRNKVDEETYITLKSTHGSETPVVDEARYKILAIENEAPDFIKVTPRLLGAKGFGGDDNGLSEIANSAVIDLSASWDDYIWNDLSFKGVGYARVRAEKPGFGMQVSRWVQISSTEMGTDAMYLVKTIEPFGISAEHWTHFGATDPEDTLIEWSLEIKDDVVQNKPEFDGRFFVKIARDGVITDEIIKTSTSDDSVNYSTVDMFNFRSVYTQGQHNPANATAEFKGDYSAVASPISGTPAPTNFTGHAWNEDGNVVGVTTYFQHEYSTEGMDFADGCGLVGGEGTHEFWADTEYNTDGGWIIDQSYQAVSDGGSYATNPDGAALKGLRTEGSVSKITFSSTESDSIDYSISASAQKFKTAMKSGTLFRFLSDPLNEIYRITNNEDGGWKQNFHQYRQFGSDCIKCGTRSEGGRWSHCYRAKFTISFVNIKNNLPLDTNVWDPRSALRHDGQGSSKIVLVEPTFEDGSVLDFTDGNAIWETEPKEDVGLDLYYEATDALPIRLSQENIESYAPIASPISIYRPGAFSNPIGMASHINDAGGLVVASSVRDVVGIRKSVDTGVYPYKIALNDNLNFIHSNGGSTAATVIDHMYSIPEYNNTIDPDKVATYKSTTTFTNLACTATTSPYIYGCTNELALNYNPLATADNETCIFATGTEIPYISGCTDPNASNYDPDATDNNGSCVYETGTNPADPETYVPQRGEMWSTDLSGLSADGYVVTRTEDTEGYLNGFILIPSSVSPTSGGGGSNQTWDNWDSYFNGDTPPAGLGNDVSWATKPNINVIVNSFGNEDEDMTSTSWWGGYSTISDLLGSSEIWTASDSGSDGYYWKAGEGFGLDEKNHEVYKAYTVIFYNTNPTPIVVDVGAEEGTISGSSSGGNRSTTQTNLVLDSSPDTDFNTTGNRIWQAISAKNNDGTAYKLPVGMFITNISGTNLTYTTSGANGVGVEQGSYSITFQEVTGYYKLDSNVYSSKTTLPWFNCYSFGNGLESDRIRDDYNAPQIDNGVKVSTLLDSYGEERRGSGMIYSGIYNSTSGVNSLNEFNMAEKITKDLNPSYGSIQALKTRDTNVVAFCEDKVFKVLANKDALYNADGSVNLIASDRVLGSATAFAGEYGISSNPESLAVDGYRMYFTDKQRNKVLRLSMDGLTPISDIGMTSWFRDNLNHSRNVKKQELIGTFDDIKGEYNLSLRHLGNNGNTNTDEADITVSFNERSKGWSSFKSFVPETGLSINDEYLTGKIAKLWSHHDSSVNANTFYGESLVASTIDVLFNENPGSVKSFLAMNYEGSQAKINEFITESLDGKTYNDGEYYNLTARAGWYVDSFSTDLQKAQVPDFKQKEGKWFNYISGVETNKKNLDTSEFSVQGIGVLASSTEPTVNKVSLTIRENND